MAVVRGDRGAQNAAAKLSALGISVSLGADKQLRGAMQFTRIIAPVTANNIRKGNFVVHGDALTFTDPPLDVLGPFSFVDVDDAAALEKRVQNALERRMALLIAVDSRLKSLRVMTAIDPERLVSVGAMTAGEYKLDLEADPEGVHVVRVLTRTGKSFDVPRSQPPIDVAEYSSQNDLEMYLTMLMPRLLQAGAQAQQDEEEGEGDRTDIFDAAGAQLEPLAAPAGVPTLGMLLQRFGDHAVPARIELVSVYAVGKKKFRLIAHHEAGMTFRARLIDADMPDARGLWSGELDLNGVHRVDDFVASIIGVGTLPQPGQKPQVQKRARTQPFRREPEPPPPPEPVGPGMLPSKGEVWVMNVVVEMDDGTNVRYVGIDADNRPYGAPRTMPRADFFHVFSAAPNGAFRLCVLIEDVRGDTVMYRQMDAARVPGGDIVRIPVSHLAAAFVPEAMLY